MFFGARSISQVSWPRGWLYLICRPIFPKNPRGKDITGLKDKHCWNNLPSTPTPHSTVVLFLNKSKSELVTSSILSTKTTQTIPSYTHAIIYQVHILCKRDHCADTAAQSNVRFSVEMPTVPSPEKTAPCK
jgi:hypothetical protein